MDDLVRLLLRFVLVPLGYGAAVLAGTLVIVFGAWQLGAIDVATEEGRAAAIFGYVFAAPVLLVTLLGVMWLPAAIGVLFSEAFAIRSFVFHAANGASVAWVSWRFVGDADPASVPIGSPTAVIAAGLAAGLAYWLVAGSSAGFWKPVFRRSPAANLPLARPENR